MAALSKGTPPMKTHPLRNEIFPESTDDESTSRKSIVQVPNSDALVPETQLEEHIDYCQNHDVGSEDREATPSPSISRILERNKVEDKTETSGLIAFGLARPPSAGTTTGFAFAPNPNALNKTSSQQKVIHVDQISVAVELDESKGADDGGAATSHPVHMPPSPMNDMLQQSVLKPQSVEVVNEKDSASQHERIIPCVMSNNSRVLTQSTSGTPPSAQVGLRTTHGTGERRPRRITGKVFRKSKKSSAARQHSPPWPPRKNTAVDGFNKLPFSVPSMQIGAFNAQACNTIGVAQKSNIIPENCEVPHGPLVCQEAHSRHPSVGQVHTRSSSHIVKNDRPNDTPEVHCSGLDEILPNVSHKQIQEDKSEHPQNALLKKRQMSEEQRLHASQHPTQLSQWQGMPSCISAGQLSHVSPESTCVSTSQEVRHNSMTHTKSRLEDAPVSNQQWQQTLHHDGLNLFQESAYPNTPDDAILHQTSSRAGPQRVRKPQQPARTVNSLELDIDCCFKSLKFALLADRSQTKHAQTLESKHFEELKAVLQDKINSQKLTIAELKAERREQDASFARLTDKAKTNQKYVAGLRSDYEKLHKSVDSLQEENKKVLWEKIAEVESEKESLRCKFDVATEASSKSQKNTMSMLEQMYTRWLISESNKKDLAENLKNQKLLYEDEKKKRNDLEKKLLSSVLTLQNQLHDGFSPLAERLVQLQAAVHNIAADEKPHAGVKECLDALQQIQKTPFLTTKDVQKAERMLRFIHDSIHSKVSVLSGSLNDRSSPVQEIQTYINDQLQDLRTELLKYEEIVSEKYKVLQLNDSLQNQLGAQQQHCQELNAKIEVLQNSEACFEVSSAQLERELQDFKNLTHSQGSELLELEREMTSLRHRLRQVQDDLEMSNTKADQAEQLRKEQEQVANNSKKCYEECKAKLLEVDKKRKETKHESLSETREKAMQEYRRIFEEKESVLKNDIHSLTIECDKKQEKIQELNSEVDAARVRLQEERKEASAVESDLKSSRKDKMDVEVKLKDAQKIASRISELENLEEQLRQKSDEIQFKTRETEYLRSKVTDLQSLHDQLQVQTFQYDSMIKVMRQEHAAQLSEERKKAQAASNRAQDQNIVVQKEKDDLRSELSKIQDNESEWNSMRTTISSERDKLQRQVIEIRAEKDAVDAELLHVQAELSEKLKKSEDSLRTQMDNLQRQLTQSDAFLRESEAKNRRLEAEHPQQLESYKKKAEEMCKQLEIEWTLKLKEARTQTAQTKYSPISEFLATPSTPLRNIHTGKVTKRVNRQINSVIDVRESPNSQHSIASRSEYPHNQHDDPTGFYFMNENSRGIPRSQEILDDDDISIIDPSAEPVEETQEIEGLPMSCCDLDNAFRPGTQEKPLSQQSNSTDLSTISSERMAQIELEAEFDLPPVIHQHGHGTSKQPPEPYAIDALIQSDDISVANSSSSFSQDRPRSRANTASRMMPPPARISHHFEQRNTAFNTVSKEVTKQHSYEKVRNELDNSDVRSPDSTHSQAAPEQIDTHIDPRLLGRFSRGHDRPQASQNRSSQKRKASATEVEQGASSKKSRVPAQYRSPQSSSLSAPYSSGSSRVKSRGKMLHSFSSTATSRVSNKGLSPSENNSSRRQSSSSTRSQTTSPKRRFSSRLKNTKTGKGMEGRFSQELGTPR